LGSARTNLGLHVLPFWKADSASLEKFDFRNGSRVVQGLDYLGRLPGFDARDIRPYEALRLVFNRIGEALLDAFPLITKVDVSKPERILTVYKISKVNLAYRDALLIVAGLYDSNPKRRVEEFARLVSTGALNKSELLGELVMLAQNARKNPVVNWDMTRVRNYWFQTRQVCESVLEAIRELTQTQSSCRPAAGKNLRHGTTTLSNRVPIVPNLANLIETILVTRRLPRAVLTSDFMRVGVGGIIHPAILKLYLAMGPGFVVDNNILTTLGHEFLGRHSIRLPEDPVTRWWSMRSLVLSTWSQVKC